MKIGVIIDGSRVTRWQAEALRTLENDHEFVIYSCSNTTSARRHPRHALYYLLNLFTIRNRLTQSVELPQSLRVADNRTFEASSDGPWQSLPRDFLAAQGAL